MQHIRRKIVRFLAVVGATTPDSSLSSRPAHLGAGNAVFLVDEMMRNSTLRFFARPAAVLLSAIGLSDPYPLDDSRLASTPFVGK